MLPHSTVCALPADVMPQVAYAHPSAHALKAFWSSLETTFRCCISWILSTKTRNCIAMPTVDLFASTSCLLAVSEVTECSVACVL